MDKCSFKNEGKIFRLGCGGSPFSCYANGAVMLRKDSEEGYKLGDAIEFILKWVAYICFSYLALLALWELFAFIWIVILKKRDYDRTLFWLKPRSKRKSKNKKKKRAK